MGKSFFIKIAAATVLSCLVPRLVFASLGLSQIPAIIPIKNDFYTIEKVKPAKEEGILKFEVSSAHAVYEVEGFRPLIKLLSEIEIIEKIRRHNQGSSFFDGAAASVEGTVDGLGNLVEHPIDSVKGMGKAVGKIGGAIGGVFHKREETERSTLRDSLLSSTEREIAKEFKADVYTSNPYLKKLIRNMAQARAGGKSAVLVLKLLFPVAMAASIVIAAGTVNSAADELADNVSRKDLYRRNKDAYLLMGLDEKKTKELLNAEFLSPREKTYFRFYYEKLKNAENVSALAEAMAEAKTEWEIRRELYEAEMAAALAEHAKITRLKDTREGLMVLDDKHKLTFLAAYDDLEDGKKIIKQTLEWQKETLAAQAEILNAGYTADSFKNEAAKAGIKVSGWACLKENGEQDV
jgi:hypothetical protein